MSSMMNKSSEREEEFRIRVSAGLILLLCCSLFFVTLLYAFFFRFLAFLVASSPVLVLTTILLGVVLVFSEPNPNDDHHHVYKKIRHVHSRQPKGSSINTNEAHVVMPSATSLVEDSSSESSGSKEELAVAVEAVAWTAEDEKSIQSIGSLELERDARLEKLMSRRSMQYRQRHHHLINLEDNTYKKNPFDHEDNLPGSAPSMTRNPFFSSLHDNDSNNSTDAPPYVQAQAALLGGLPAPRMIFRRHESFTVGAPFIGDFRPSRLRPYFVTDKMHNQPSPIVEGGEASDKSPSSSSSSSSSASPSQAPIVAPGGSGNVEPPSPSPMVAVDVELISDSSDDDISLLGGDDQDQQIKSRMGLSDDDDGESFEVERITQQVAAAASGQKDEWEWVAPSKLASVEENETREREVSEIREHDIMPDAAAPPPPPVAGGDAKHKALAPAAAKSIKFKAPSKKAVFFRK